MSLAERGMRAMPHVRQKRVNSMAATNKLRWALKKKQKELEPMPRPKDMKQLEAEAVEQLRKNAGRLGL